MVTRLVALPGTLAGHIARRAYATSHCPECPSGGGGTQSWESEMKESDGINSTECREIIRRRAFELADSGIFDDWEAIRRALCSRFHDAHLHEIFASPFCRIDIDQRCRTARTSGSRASASPEGNGNRESVKPHLAVRAKRVPSRPMDTRRQRRRSVPAEHSQSQGLAGAIAALLGGDRELTAPQMAQELGAGQREVQRALRELLANHEVRIARRTPRSAGGRPARIFALGLGVDGDADIAASAASCWPKADPVVLRAMDAIARRE